MATFTAGDLFTTTVPALDIVNADETWKIPAGVFVYATASFGIRSLVADTRIVNSGVVVGDGLYGVHLGGANAALVNQASGAIAGPGGVELGGPSPDVVNRGSIGGVENRGIAFLDAAVNFTLDNEGTIFAKVRAIHIEGDDGLVVNSGVIRSDGTAIRAGSSDLVEIVNHKDGVIRGDGAAIVLSNGSRLDLDNRGKIVGDVESISPGLKDVILNSGRIDGQVALGEGADVYKGATGRVGTVLGEDGDDRLYAGPGDNVLIGGLGEDTVSGGSGDDTLSGGLGSDTIIGGSGADDLYGLDTVDVVDDGSRDVFVYRSLSESGASGPARDSIFGFIKGSGAAADRIDLSDIDANPSKPGDQKFTLVSAFTSAKGELRRLEQGVNTILQLDGDNDAAVDMAIVVVGVVGLKGFDFVL